MGREKATKLSMHTLFFGHWPRKDAKFTVTDEEHTMNQCTNGAR